MSSLSLEKSKRQEQILRLLEELDTKGDLKNSGIELLKSLAVAGVGVAVGAAVGRPSLLLGAGATFAGYYFGIPKVTQLGVGMMSCGGFQLKEKGFSGTEMEGLEGAKERLKALGNDLKHRLYLDKFTKSKAQEKPKQEGTAGLGEVQHFKYPADGLDMGSLDAIEQEITKSGEMFEQRQMSGSNEDVSGADYDISGVEDKIY